LFERERDRESRGGEGLLFERDLGEPCYNCLLFGKKELEMSIDPPLPPLLRLSGCIGEILLLLVCPAIVLGCVLYWA
jgi:hypothetical protein